MFKKYANRDYDEIKDAWKIAEKADVNIMEKYSNFKDFINSLFDCT